MTHNDAFIIFLMGIAGSGKGTQGELLQQRYGFASIEVGKIFRTIATEDSPRGHSISERLEKGIHMEDSETTPLVEEALRDLLQNHDKIIIDGYARRETQAQDALDMMQRLGISHVVVLAIEIPEDVARKRLEDRHRNDDTPETIQHRIDHFYSSVKPAIDYFARNCKTVFIDGYQEQEKVHQDIVKELGLE
ncbi:MAG: hypothetical protein A3H59_02810 [Candidatus Jacksonbacteria bacterium RIFCSPLOWO2_02_FULL_43_9]|nr:MAG: Adenylate kinase [Parcubacteria group bacterium GW2011_GWA2_43_13]OGY69171.1 MAG: hypothetical protein A3B94_01275 [Candidatus Jacksonbacteria bacterium RIFCSPHIGHO2_02_FULL_43_10]OGY70486.1 MAG: hypothetical protein A2986_02045 [Candidatus Jacksonbacteria bacterium RIFCSPLOWO2_01_FULL_44_13]OGY72811.1 MAG: hypothetical protein A3H59_02810 [Candidatus Jacksonbacteria bacterium RIFCSPLOWO2_02_FULL_43_9]